MCGTQSLTLWCEDDQQEAGLVDARLFIRQV